MSRLSQRPLLLGTLLPALGLFLAICGAYAFSLRGEFLWDDDLHVTANPTIIGPLGLKEIWTTARANYFPLVLTSFWAQHALWGLDPLGYRLVTLLCHAASALLLWQVLRRLQIPGAWLGAALWALHPVQVESVAWISELKNTQSAIFFLAAIWSWLRWIGPKSRRIDYVLALVFSVLAILSKPSTVMLPIALGLCTWWSRGCSQITTPKVGNSQLRRLWAGVLPLIPFFALSAVAAGWTIWEQKYHSGAQGAEWQQTLPERCIIAGRVLWFYAGKLAWPEPLIFIYPRWAPDAGQPLQYVPVILAAGVVFELWRRRDWGPAYRAGFLASAFFTTLLFPVLGFFSVYFFRYSFVGDHFQYLASMGPLALLGAGLAQLPHRCRWSSSAAILGALAILTGRHGSTFLNNEVLWRDTLAKNPAAQMARLNLGDTLGKQGRHLEAIACFLEALRFDPDAADAHNDIGAQYVLIGRAADAVPHLQRAVQLRPRHPEPYNNLGNALAQLGRGTEALAQYQRALEIDPVYAEAHGNAGAQLAELGRAADALPHLQEALRLRPGDVNFRNNLGKALRLLGRVDEAVALHREVLRDAPDSGDANASLGLALSLAGRIDEAILHLRRAVAVKPGVAVFHGYLARALAATGQADAALAEFEHAVRLAPGSAEARNNLGSHLAQLGRLAEALPHLEAAIEAEPDFAPARSNYASALAALGRWPDAARQFEHAVRLEPEQAMLHAQLAVARVNAGDPQGAVPAFETALRLNPGSAEVHQNFAQLLRSLGRLREALHHFEEAARWQQQRR